MELLIILYLVYANLLPPVGGCCVDPAARRTALEKFDKYSRRRIDVDVAEQMALREIFHDIENAYTNSNVEAMARAMACVSNRVDYIGDKLYRELEKGIETVLYGQFLLDCRRSSFDSIQDFETFSELHIRVALFLGNCACRRKEYDPAPMRQIEFRTYDAIKKYVDRFHVEGKRDFEAVARGFLDKWIEHIESERGFTRWYARCLMAAYEISIAEGEFTRESAVRSVRKAATPLIRLGYTPKWLEEFK